jgi:prepilin-type N-terminal cleavage/methylation domain-containing protein
MQPVVAQRRRAFSLVELMVVIVIIVILVGLLLAGVQNVRDSAARMETLSRITQIQAAVSLAKAKGGMDYVWSGTFRLRTSYSGNEPELDLLKRMFPQMDLANNGLPTSAQADLDANQALLFLLTGGTPMNFSGFSNDPRRPFTPPSPGEKRKGPWLQVRPEMIWQPDPNTHHYLVDAYRRAETGVGTPFIVFGTKPLPYQAQTVSTFPYSECIVGPVTPYQRGGKYLNENGFQIISAGKDRKFGFSGTLPLPPTDPFGVDDLTNFSNGPLGSIK